MVTSESVERIVGEGLRRVRLRRGLTRSSLGEAAGLPAVRIEQYEMGERRIPAHHLVRLTIVLGVEIGAVFGKTPAFDDLNNRLLPS